LVIFFKVQVVAVIDDFTILVRCGAVQKALAEENPNKSLLNIDIPAGAEARPLFIVSVLRHD
jgi:hypothetical protein